jgi:hypothetical protein
MAEIRPTVVVVVGVHQRPSRLADFHYLAAMADRLLSRVLQARSPAVVVAVAQRPPALVEMAA